MIITRARCFNVLECLSSILARRIFFRRPRHLPNIPERRNNMMKAKRQRYGGKTGKRTRRSLKREGKEVV
jgi:hypothetical protein